MARYRYPMKRGSPPKGIAKNSSFTQVTKKKIEDSKPLNWPLIIIVVLVVLTLLFAGALIFTKFFS